MDQSVADNGYAKLESLVDMAHILGRQNDYEEVLRLVVEKASALAGSDAALVMLVNPRTRDTLRTVFAQKNADDEQSHFVHTNISGWVVLNDSPFLSPDIRSDGRFRKRLFERVRAKSAICVPLKVENVVLGTLLLLRNEESGPFTEVDLSLAGKVSAIASPFLRCTQEIARYFTAPPSKHALVSKYATLGLLGKSNAFISLLVAIEAAARCDVTILLEGESGTGKELVARALHRLSSRSESKFVAIDCGAIQPHLVESELFGHVKGAFTGAVAERKGLLQEADGGTLFMDEINNLPFEMQSKLLRVLQDQEVRPVGSNQTRTIDVRIISASSSSLREMVMGKRFREDLYYRLNVYPMLVPALRERADDIPLLAGHFLKTFSREQRKEIDGFHEEVMDYMKRRQWTGNVRELSNVIERLVTLTTANQRIIDRNILPPELQKELKSIRRTHEDGPSGRSLGESLAGYEERLIRTALESCNWNQSRAARILRISEHTMRYKMSKLRIEKPA
jgi:transcriptional regulator with GAF, ATPase, and Fis domain